MNCYTFYYSKRSFDHEDYYTNYNMDAQNFESMFDEFDIYLKEWMNRTNEKIT